MDPLTRDVRRVEIDPERLAGWVERFAARHGDLAVSPAPGGLSLRAPDGATAVLLPPWPGEFAALDDLVAFVLRPRLVGLLLVRRGGYAVGVAEGATLADSKVGSRYVQGKTKAGGWSQQRYARRRDAQAQSAFAAAADAAARILVPRVRDLHGVVAGGDRAAVSAVLDDPRLPALRRLPRSRFLAVPDPRQRVLQEAVRRARAVAVDVHDPLRG